jgi:hypothetical protein
MRSRAESAGFSGSRQRPTETKTETTAAKTPLGPVRSGRHFLVLTSGGGCGIRTREGLHPTRFPSLSKTVQGRPVWSVQAWRSAPTDAANVAGLR